MRIAQRMGQGFAVGLLAIAWGAGCTGKVLSPEGEGGAPGNSMNTGGTSGSDGSGGTTSAPSVTLPDATIPIYYDAYTGPTEDANCGLVDFVLDRTPAPVVLAQDRSYSMSQTVRAPGIGSKWDNVRAAVQAVLSKTNTSVAWGLKFFPNEKACQVSVGPEIAPTLMNADPIITRLNSIKSERTAGNLTDGTPTHKLLNDLREYLVKLGAVNKYIVLATDGDPTCAGDKASASNYEEARAAARAVVQAGIKIAVVGISFGVGVVFPNDIEQDSGLGFLNFVAELGGMPATNPDNPYMKYYPAEDTQELVKAFNAIAEQVYSCTFKLPKTPPHKDDVAVKLDGEKIPRDATSGWEYDDSTLTSLTLHGTACDKIKDSNRTASKVDVKIIMGCPGVLIP